MVSKKNQATGKGVAERRKENNGRFFSAFSRLHPPHPWFGIHIPPSPWPRAVHAHLGPEYPEQDVVAYLYLHLGC